MHGHDKAARRIAMTLGLLLLLAACGGQDEAQTAGETPSPSPEATAAAPPSPAATGTAPASPPEGATSVTAWYVRSTDTQLWLEPRTVPLEEPTSAVARAAIEAVVRGPGADSELTTLAPAGTEVLGVDLADGTLEVNLSEQVRQGNVGAEGEALFAQQLAYSATQFDNIDNVRLLVESEPVDELWGHIDWSQPITREEFVVSPVVIEEPEPGAAVESGEVTVSGTANVFEATVVLRLLAPDGTVSVEDFTTASCGTGCRGTWSHTFSDVTEPGTWTVEAAETDPSDGEGRPPFTARRTFTVS